MGRIVVTMSVSLDGVMQGLGGPDDERGGFAHGGWGPGYMDEVMMSVMQRGMAACRALLFGRRTYEHFAGFWPHQTDGNPFTAKLDATPKYVVSTTLAGPLPWQNSTVVDGTDAEKAAAGLKAEVDGDIVVLGSGVLARALAAAGLVDRYVLSIHPLVLGSGTRLFAARGAFARLRLVESVPTTTGVIVATYDVPGAPAAV
ncbi:dihydrofolate reductase family protein [Yinghuangia soli]|uniref:Dihydrofolate reductase family protein n=1 Tax=Yinghuangia soli TaxID=2908204 RepID=A0AA41PZA5_9ACTN|nr:dihydrofolate reductase family protein [Yinghuangia soli]MCF2527886.1 dihydrofolate reductase family protein [Yinghuangia soli]